MEPLISNLVDRFERGALSRRELIQGLGMVLAASTPALGQTQKAGLQGMRIDHVSVQVADLARSSAFYQSLFNFRVVSEDKENQIVRLGTAANMVSLHQKSPIGVDHFAIGIENFNKDDVTRKLLSHGLTPLENLDAGLHVKDPDGVGVQFVPA